MDSSRPRRAATIVDVLILVLAVVSVGLLMYITFFDVSPRTAYVVSVVDTSICGVFAVEFVWRWRAAGWGFRFLLRGWYEILGMIPIANPALRSFRLLRIVVVLGRLARVVDRTWGERLVQRIVQRFSHAIVQAIKRPITIAILDEVVKVLETGNYPQNLAHSLTENQHRLTRVVTEKVKNDAQAGAFSRLPFHDQVITSIVDTSIRVTAEVLHDQRIDDFFADIVRENRWQIRAAVEQGLHEAAQTAQHAEFSRAQSSNTGYS